MRKSIEVSAKTEEEAIASALAQLGLSRDDVSIEIVERAKSGFLGIGSQSAVIRVSYDAPDEPVAVSEPVKPRVEEKPAKAAAAKPAVRPLEAGAAGELEGKARDFLGGLLSHMGIEAELVFGQKDNGGLAVELKGEDMGAAIGRRGETLDAIQHLTNYVVNRGVENRQHISVDTENYRSKREESLVRLAEKMAAKALKYKRSMALEPMNSYERHVIHTALQEYDGVSTCSTGMEPNRRVVISCDKGN